MDAKRLTGPQAGSLKYDLLTALTVAGLHGSQGFQTSMMRLVALVTARYNWRRDEFSVGQRDIARLWGVNERTVKREVKRLTGEAILICKRHGVRGRVAAYRLNYAEIYRRSQPHWHCVGPDFEERMRGFIPDVATSVVKVDFGQSKDAPDDEPSLNTGEWRHVLRALGQSSPELYANWFSALTLERYEAGQLTIRAPTKFKARYIETHFIKELWQAAETALGPVDKVSIIY